MNTRRRIVSVAIWLLALCGQVGWALSAEEQAENNWVQLFNGRDLDGWTPKFVGEKLGVNYLDTFRAEDGVLKVCYDKYEKLDGKFGHLFYEAPYSHYVLRAEYRVVGEQVAGGPQWALRNNGLMLHAQDPNSMGFDQNFPVSIEVQLLGGDPSAPRRVRSTANLCTPGTHVVMEGKLVTQHCINSKSPTFRGDQWVTVEVEVHGSRLVRHLVNVRPVMEYIQPQLDPEDKDAKRLLATGQEKLLDRGWIAIQAESHPFEFQAIELRELPSE